MLALLLTLVAQHEGHEIPPASSAPLGIPDARAGSGTAWLPDASPMHAAHFQRGAWSLMVHGIVAPLYDHQGGPRGDDQFNVINWGMLTAQRPFGRGGGRLALRAMASTDPWTVGSKGYPLLLQSGESYKGAPLHDRQHPHDLWIELAALWERPIGRNVAALLYVAAVGEPALGPPAFQHRPSAESDPFAPLGHHWQDATHITYGGATSNSFLLEGDLEMWPGSHFFMRGERVRKTAEDLVIPGPPPDRAYDLTSLVGGYLFQRGTLGLGARGSIGFIPASLAPDYGSRSPLGIAVYGRWRPR